MTDTYSITYKSDGTTYNLNGYDIDHGLTLSYLGDQGFGLAPLHRITTRGPLQDGDSDIDFRLDPRVLQIPLIVQNTSASPKFNAYSIRQKLLQMFRPQHPGVIAVTTSDGSSTISRNIDVKVLGGLTFDVDPTEYHVRTVVQLRADDPTWYNPTQSTFSFSQVEIGIGKNTTNAGNWFAFPLIRIDGPITNPYIENQNLGQFIQLTGTITTGNYIEIDLSYGRKTVVDNAAVNRINWVSATSNLATWSLKSGQNVIAVTGSGLGASSKFTFTYNPRYTGI